jgi:hypothetical protein
MIGWLDCASGASGDMVLGALVDAGVSLDVIAEAVAAVAPEPIALHSERVTRCGFTALRVHVGPEPAPPHRTWLDVRRLLEQAPLAEPVRSRALSTFGRLAQAEAVVHGVPADDVAFHEVGALDAIADIVGACAGFAELDLTALNVSPVAVGSGTASTAHGLVSVPPPAVAELLRGVPTYAGAPELELCTPTGAALLTEWVSAWGPQPPMAVSAIGTGAGGRDLRDQSNVLRLLVGEPTPGRGEQPLSTQPDQLLLESNVDDFDPRLWPAVLAQLMAAGAADAWLTPILMKKGRPAHTLSVLVASERGDAVRHVVFTETAAIGLRETAVRKHALERLTANVDVFGQPVRVKLACHDGTVVNAQPEYDDVVAAAAAIGRPVKVVLAEAVAQARKLW